jgi:D-alanyl-D-alanine carboxypeptidase
VAVVLGGKSGAARDSRMRELIEQHVMHASARRTAPPIMEAGRREGTKAAPAAEKSEPAIVVAPASVSPAALAPAESPAPTLAGESHPANPPRAEAPQPLAEASQPQAAAPQPQVQPARAQAPATSPTPAKAIATAKLSHSRKPASQPATAATSATTPVAPRDRKGAW